MLSFSQKKMRIIKQENPCKLFYIDKFFYKSYYHYFQQFPAFNQKYYKNFIIFLDI